MKKDLTHAPTLSHDELAALMRRIFHPQSDGARLAVLVDLPDLAARKLCLEGTDLGRNLEGALENASILAAEYRPGILRRQSESGVNDAAFIENSVLHTSQVSFPKVRVIKAGSFELSRRE